MRASLRRYLNNKGVPQLFVGAGENYYVAQLLEHVLRECGDDLSRANVMKHATAISNLQLPMQIPGVLVNTSSRDYFPLEQLRMMRFDGSRWIPFGEVITP